MFIIGNMNQLAKSCELWQKINQKLIDAACIGPQLKLQCRNHQDVLAKVKSLEDFRRFSLQGGCNQFCDYTIPLCGHRCSQYCHVIKSDHKNVKCTRECERTCGRGHVFKDLCFRKCPPCKAKVEKYLPCAHSHMVECSISEKEFH